MIVRLPDYFYLYAPLIDRYGTGGLITEIFGLPYQEPLHPDVGVVYVKINQRPVGILTIRQCWILHVQAGKPPCQAEDLTNKIKKLQ